MKQGKDRIIKNSEDKKEIRERFNEIKDKPWRNSYHIRPLIGLLNDPNGFSFFQGKWHLFYQWYPFSPIHGYKHWYHVTSDDLFHWQNEAVALIPDRPCENHGCYSGSAMVKDGQLYLAYTGNGYDEKGIRHQVQLLATSKDGKTFLKRESILINENVEYSEHQRDPKLIEHDGRYYIIIGARNRQDKGCLLLYGSEKVDGSYVFEGEITIDEAPEGYMYECPDLEYIDGKWCLFMCPQRFGTYENENSSICICMIGQMDFVNRSFKVESGPLKVDDGFEFYACQCVNGPDNEHYMIGWVGGPGCEYPREEEYGVSGILTMVRKLNIINGRLVQRPVCCLKNETERKVKSSDFISSPTKISVISDGNSFSMKLSAENEASGLEIAYDDDSRLFKIDRSKMKNQFNEAFGITRSVQLTSSVKQLDIYLDNSCFEVFINGNEKVFTGRIFPADNENKIYFSAGLDVSVTEMETIDETCRI